MARQRQYMTNSVLRQQAIDSNSYTEPEDNDFLPDSDDFSLSESSDRDMSDEPVPYMYVILKSVWIQNYTPFSTRLQFVTMTTLHSCTQKQTLVCKLSTCAVS